MGGREHERSAACPGPGFVSHSALLALFVAAWPRNIVKILRAQLPSKQALHNVGRLAYKLLEKIVVHNKKSVVRVMDVDGYAA